MNQFTPLFDEITQQYGIVTAAVYGYIWRKCQMESGHCSASFQTIADELNVSRRTAVTHVKQLVNDGLITDLTPNANRKPHKYLVQEMQQTREINALALVQEMQQTREINAPKDTETKKDTTAAARALEFYQNNVGGIGHSLSMKIKTAVQMHTEQTVIDAMQEAVDNNVLKWSYVDAILRNWEQNGRVKQSPNGHKPNGRIDKHALKDALWHIVTRSKDYTEAKTQASPDEWGFLKAMGKWRDVRSLNETTFNIRFYEVFKNANH